MPKLKSLEALSSCQDTDLRQHVVAAWCRRHFWIRLYLYFHMVPSSGCSRRMDAHVQCCGACELRDLLKKTLAPSHTPGRWTAQSARAGLSVPLLALAHQDVSCLRIRECIQHTVSLFLISSVDTVVKLNPTPLLLDPLHGLASCVSNWYTIY